MASLSAAGSPAGTSRPVWPSVIASGVPPTRVATIGAPAAIDSSSTFESASFSEGMTDTAALPNNASERRIAVTCEEDATPDAQVLGALLEREP